jgi:uncharacterized protein (TIGR00369 family)
LNHAVQPIPAPNEDEPLTERERDAVAWLRSHRAPSLADALGIEFTSVSPRRVVATMPVDDRTRQPFGILHGGASVALAETVCSVAGTANIDPHTSAVVGIEINANHIRSKPDGVVTATGTPIHLGRSTQVWEIRIVDEQDRLISISRCTLAVVERR